MVIVKTVLKDSKEYLEALSLRIDVLRKPLGLSYAQTDLDLEKDDIHFVAIKNDRVLGCLLLRPLSNSLIKMRQVAVHSDFQKLGIGQALVAASEEYARTQGILKIELSARKDAVPFYQRLGYLNTGEPYIEVTLPHQKMEKHLGK
jgi:predicted GNAT family N-acyltransferase